MADAVPAVPPPAPRRDKPPAPVMEVWGDTVDPAHLAWSILIGAVVSLGVYFLARSLLTGVVAAPDVARAYAMLFGLGGCLVSGAICARLFPPKRAVVEHGGDPLWREEALEQLATEPGGLGSVADLPAAAVRELEELGLYDLFAARDGVARRGAAGGDTGIAARPRRADSAAE